MKNWVGVVLLSAGLAQASSILLQSGVTVGEFNNITGTNMDIPMLEPAWTPNQGDGSSWISFENTGWQVIAGVGSTVITLPNSSPPGPPNAKFYQPFTDNSGSLLTGSIRVWADDTAAVYLDGVLLMAASNTQQPGQCSDGITCTGPGTLINFTAAPGTHTLEFDVYQLGGSTYGVMYDGLVSDNAGVPEPGTYVLIASGLLALALAGRKRVF
jgi:hypothetical protein